MPDLSPFCTCKDLSCPNHPKNHDKGCAPCISKNLALGEIPNCFFDKAGIQEDRDYSWRSFALSVLKKDGNS